MKKLLLLLTSTMLASTNSLASEQAGKFYLKGSAGLSKLNKQSVAASGFGENVYTLAFSSKNNFFAGGAVGYNITDKIRIDGAFDYFKNGKLKSKDQHGSNHQVKYQINTMTLNSYMDLFTTHNISLFAGAGLGAALLKGQWVMYGDTFSKKVKKSNFTYSLHLGISGQIANQLHTELMYSWRDFGKNKYNIGPVYLSNKFQGHHVSLGLRYNI